MRGENLRVESIITGFESLSILGCGQVLELFLGCFFCACCPSTILTWIEEGLNNDFKHND